MGGFVTVAVYLIVIVVSFMGGNLGLGWLGVGLGVASLWTWGVASNFAVEQSSRRIRQMQENLMAEGLTKQQAMERTSGIHLRSDPQAMPNWLAALHLALTVLGIVLLIVVFVVR